MNLAKEIAFVNPPSELPERPAQNYLHKPKSFYVLAKFPYILDEVAGLRLRSTVGITIFCTGNGVCHLATARKPPEQSVLITPIVTNRVR
jgi:hypothetical protein